jgi:hypothetical protein
MVIINSKQAVSEHVLALYNDRRNWSAQFPQKPSDHAVLTIGEMSVFGKGCCKRDTLIRTSVVSPGTSNAIARKIGASVQIFIHPLRRDSFPTGSQPGSHRRALSETAAQQLIEVAHAPPPEPHWDVTGESAGACATRT